MSISVLTVYNYFMQLLKKVTKETKEEILVADAKLGSCIKEKFDVPCLATSSVQELMRGIRSQISSLISGIPDKEMAAFALGEFNKSNLKSYTL